MPVWLTKSALFDDFGLTGSASSEWGQKQGGTVTVVDPAHPAAAGRTGTVTVQGANRYVGWGNPTADAAVVGETAGDPSVFTIGSGDTLEWGTPAPSCRSVFPAVGGAPTSYTADGWAMFDAMTQWALSCPLPPPPPPPSGAVEQVVLVSVDGLNPQALVDLGPAGVPSFTRMRTEGASTLNARTLVERTETLPNHVSMVTSRWVDLPDGTGVTFNSDNASTVHVSAGGYVPSIFDVVHDAGGSTALFATKGKFDFIDRSYDGLNGAPDVTGADDGTDKIDTYRRSDSVTMTTKLVEALTTSRPTFSMLHLRDPDRAGHEFGFMSPEYLQAVRDMDVQLGRLLDAVAGDPHLAASTVVVLTTDHGGGERSHSDPLQPVNYTIPFLVWGFDVEPGADLYALNSDDRADPGTLQPAYAEPVQPIRNAEVGNLVADLLRLPAVPTSRIGDDQGLDVSGLPDAG